MSKDQIHALLVGLLRPIALSAGLCLFAAGCGSMSLTGSEPLGPMEIDVFPPEGGSQAVGEAVKAQDNFPDANAEGL